MDNWGEFQTVGDEERSRQPAAARHSWISWVCLVLFLSTAGMLLAAFALRLFILLTVGLAFGWFGRNAIGTHIDIDAKAWALLLGAAVAVHLCWQLGQLAVPTYGPTAGMIIAFLSANAAVGTAVALAQFQQSRRNKTQSRERALYEARLREAREKIKAVNEKVSRS